MSKRSQFQQAVLDAITEANAPLEGKALMEAVSSKVGGKVTGVNLAKALKALEAEGLVQSVEGAWDAVPTAAPETSTEETPEATEAATETEKPSKKAKKAKKAKKNAPKKDNAAKAEAPSGKEAPETATRDPRIPEAGTSVERVYKGQTYTLEVGEVSFVVRRPDGDSSEHKSLTDAARAVTGQKIVNGFTFWKLGEADSAAAQARQQAAKERKIRALADRMLALAKAHGVEAVGAAVALYRSEVDGAVAEPDGTAADESGDNQ